MKKQIAIFVSILLTISLIFDGIFISTLSLQANAFAAESAYLHSYKDEQSAANKILIYHQYGDKQAEWQDKKLAKYHSSVYGHEIQTYMGSHKTVWCNTHAKQESFGWGCHIYALAHIVQWVSGEARTSSNGGDLLDEFINDHTEYPWEVSWDHYADVLTAHGLRDEDSISMTENELKTFFDQGGAFRTHISYESGHYQAAVGIARGKNNDVWIHMVDSTCYSTIWRLNKKGYEAYNFSSGDIQTKNDNLEGGEYWVTLDAFKSAFSKVPFISTNPVEIPSTPSTGTWDTISYESTNYKILKDVTLRKAPFNAADKGSFIDASDNVTVTSVAVVNNGTNLWLELGGQYAGQYIFSGYTKDGVLDPDQNQYLEYISDNHEPISSSGWSLPSGTRVQGNGFELMGDFTFPASIKSVEAEVYKSGSSTPYKESIGYPSSTLPKYFSIYTSTVNTGLPFGTLPAGDYRIDIKVNYYADRVKTKSTVINSSTFTIADASSGTTATNLTFTNVEYPKTFRINTSAGWALGSGTLESDYSLKSLSTEIRNSSGSVVSARTTYNDLSGKSISIKDKLDTYSTADNGVKFSKITTPGSYKWILTATDSAGRTLTLTMPFTAVSSGSTSTAKMSAAYTSAIPVTGVVLDLDEVTLRAGYQTTVTATVSPSNATNQSLIWNSSNTSIATVEKVSGSERQATITAVRGGTAIISCSTADGGHAASCVVHVTTSATGISLSPTMHSLQIGDTYKLTPTIYPSNATNQTVHWYTSNSSVVTVTDGLVKGISAGTATITAMAEDGGYKATCDITVTTPVSNIVLSQNWLEIAKDDYYTLSAKVYPENAANRSVSWQSSDTSIATVSNGKVTGIVVGEAVITCSATDGSGVSASCIVKVGDDFSYCEYCDDYLSGKTEAYTYGHYWTCGTCGNRSVMEGHIALCTNKRMCIACDMETDYDIAYYHHPFHYNDYEIGSSYVPYTYEHGIRCNDCGEIVDYESHWSDSCLDPYCSDCGGRIIDPSRMDHNLSDTYYADPSDSSYHYQLCIDCGYKEYEEHDDSNYDEDELCDYCNASGQFCNHYYSDYICRVDPSNTDRHVYICSDCNTTVEYAVHSDSCADEDSLCDGCGIKCSKTEHSRDRSAIPDPNNPGFHIWVCYECNEEIKKTPCYYYCSDVPGSCSECGGICNIENMSHWSLSEGLMQVDPDDSSRHIKRCDMCDEILGYEEHEIRFDYYSKVWSCQWCDVMISDDSDFKCYRAHIDGWCDYLCPDPDNPAIHYGYCDDCGERITGRHTVYCYNPGYCTVCESKCTAEPTHKYVNGACAYCNEQEIILTGIALSQTELEWESGDTNPITLVASAVPADAPIKTLHWGSSDTSVATVNNGVVTPVGPGIAWIDCREENGFYAECRVIVHGSAVLNLPSALQKIDNEAFANLAIEEVILPEGIISINSKAFAQCTNLRIINMPDSVNDIANDAFYGVGNITFICSSENDAAQYALENGIPFVTK